MYRERVSTKICGKQDRLCIVANKPQTLFFVFFSLCTGYTKVYVAMRSCWITCYSYSGVNRDWLDYLNPSRLGPLKRSEKLIKIM